MLIGYLFEPLADIASIQFVLSLIRLLFFEGCGLIQNYLTLLRTSMHAYCTLRASANILDILDDFLESLFIY